MATACGYTIAEIDKMTMADFDMLADYWASHPPVHLMVAGYLGIKPKTKSSGKELAEMLGALPGWTMH